MSEPQQFTKEEIVAIAKHQSNYCWLIVVAIAIRASIMTMVAMAIQVPVFVSYAFLAVNLGLFITAVIFMYRLGTALKLKNVWLYLVALIIPLVNLLVILHLITSATKVLRANNIKVGLMGANKEDLDRLVMDKI